MLQRGRRGICYGPLYVCLSLCRPIYLSVSVTSRCSTKWFSRLSQFFDMEASFDPSYVHCVVRCKEIRVIPKLRVLRSRTLFKMLNLENFATVSRTSPGAVNNPIKTDDDQLCLLRLQRSIYAPRFVYNQRASLLVLVSRVPSATADTNLLLKQA